MNVHSVDAGFFTITPVSGRDMMLADEFIVEWKYGAYPRRIVLPPGWKFGPGINSMPGFWRGLVNVFHLLRSSCVHDALYASKGGRREIYTQIMTPIKLNFEPLVSRVEADDLSKRMALDDGINRVQAKIINKVLRRLGQSTWDD